MTWKWWWSPNKFLPVLIVNGFSLLPFYGFPTKQALATYAKRGHGVKKMPWKLESMRDVTQYAEAINDEVIRIIKETGKEKVNLVGWSMGGVACLYALKRRGLHCLVDSMVTFGAPYGGSDLSYTALISGLYVSTGNQLRPNSMFLHELLSDDLPGDTNYVSISGQKDRICPTDSAYLPGAKNVPSNYRHSDFFANVSLHELIASQLRR